MFDRRKIKVEHNNGKYITDLERKEKENMIKILRYNPSEFSIIYFST